MTPTSRRVLLIDDDPWIHPLVAGLLAPDGFEVEAEMLGAAGLERVAAGFEGVVVLDMLLPDLDGSEVFRQLRALSPRLPVIFLTAHGSMDLAVDSIADGAFGFVDKEDLIEQLRAVVNRAHDQQTQDHQDKTPFHSVIATSASMRAVLRSLEKALASKIPVLLRGESGTGKEIIAKALHQHGVRHSGPYVAINCAGIPTGLLEAEIFGYEAGAFTGASRRKAGHLDRAQGGTLLLDEIGDMPLVLQSKLLRVLQENEYQRLGGTELLQADVRFLSATHQDLESAVKAGRFREDLFYRLAVFTVDLPPLRERPEDVEPLAQHFLHQIAIREKQRPPELDKHVLQLLQGHHFPGNVRELENVIRYAVLTCQGPRITLSDLPQGFLRMHALTRETTGEAKRRAPPHDTATPRTEHAKPETTRFPTLREVQGEHIQRALDVAGGNKTHAARLLGISRMTLYRKLEATEPSD